MPRPKSFEEEVAYYRRREAERIAAVTAVFEQSAAVHAMWTGKHPRDEMWILSRDTHPVEAGQEAPWRISRFGKDGPFGHDVRPVKPELYELAASWAAHRLAPMTEPEVMAWTSTPEYAEGVRQVAFMQAINTLSWRMSKHPANEPDLRHAYDEAWKLARDGCVEEATALIEGMFRGSPRQNPPPDFVQNPAWVTKVIADNFHRLESEIGSQWLPKFGEVRASRNRISASMKELGCGAYGCVMPTIDAGVVLKVTTDASEMDFVVKILPDLPAMITTKYLAWMWLKNEHDGRRVGLLWRESADFVDRMVDALPPERAMDALVAIRAQHDAASQALVAAMKGEMRSLPGLLAVWAGLVQRMTRVPELRFVAIGMLEAWNQLGVFFADVHEGNLGRVMRDGQYLWVITDPGNVVVVSGESSEV